MPSGSSSSGPRWEGDAAPDADQGASLGASELEKAAGAMRSLAAGRFEVVGPLGQDRGGEFAFLGRDALGRLVVLRRDPRASTQSEPEALQVIDRLDSSVPPPAGSCPVCQAPFADWDPACATCGADVAGSAEELGRGLSGEQLLDVVRGAAEGYEVLGGMPRAVGGATVYFARDPARGDLVALRFDRGSAPGRREGYTVAATRMMRPKHLYGTVGGEGSGLPSPPGAMRAASWVPGSSAPLPRAGAEDKVCPQCGEVFGGGLRFCPKDGSALRAGAHAAELVGQVIAERYHILDQLGEGGMGRVYLAEHIRMGRRCAVKVMNPRLLHDPDSVGRFNREAANASRINHPNVAAIYDFGETADDIVYLAMELVEGESLAAILGREGMIPEKRTIQICVQIADALGAAHDLGIVHRDLKPDNVMISRSRAGRDQVKVVDFGIAKATQGGKQNVTRTGFVLGTPAYMSPEQILGESLDGRSDLYSLGCIIYEMLAGQRAFAGPSGEVSIHQRLTEPPPDPRKANRNLSRKLGDVVTTAMARSPEQRFPTASALGEALSDALSEGSQRSGWRDWLPWGQGRLSPTPRPMPNPPSATAPVPLGWTEAVQPIPATPRRDTTLLRHRSTRPKGRRAWLLAGSVVGVVLVASLLWRLLTPGPAPDPPAAVAGSTSGPVSPGGGSPEATSPAPAPQPPAPPPAPAPGSGAVRLPPLPAGVQVIVDGVERPLPPEGVIELAPGRHSLVFRAPGFRRATRSAEVTSGDTATLDLELVPVASGPRPPPDAARPPPKTAPPKVGEATVNVVGDLPPGAEIFVDGQPLPAETRVMNVTPGMHWLKVSALGYRPDSTQVLVEAGNRTIWQAPRLEALPRPGPEPAPPPTTPPVVKPSAPVAGKPNLPATPAPGPAPSDRESRTEIQALLSAYEGAINARNLSRLKTLYPDMTPERESQWRDLFSKGVRDLKAALSVRGIRPISSAGQDRYWLATFTIQLTFEPDGGKAKSYKILNTAGVNRESGQWRFATLEESGE